MTIVAPAAFIGTVWNAIECAASPDHRPPRIAAGQIYGITQDAAAMGWAGRIEVMTTLEAAGIKVRANEVGEVLAILDFGFQTVFPYPSHSSTCARDDDRLAAADLAALMILLERLGLPIDPTPMCEGVRKSLRGRKFITRSELMARWYVKERHRLEPLEITAEDRPRWVRPVKSITRPAGHVAELFHDPRGQPYALRVTGPLWRPQRRSAA